MSTPTLAPDLKPGRTAAFTQRILDGIERAGNRLPHPFALFLILFLALGAISTAVSWFNVSTVMPGAKAPVPVKGLFTGEGVSWLMTTAVTNFIGFPPLGVVVVLMLAVGVAERTGMLTALVKVSLGRAPRWALPYVMALVALCAHIMSDASILVIPPIGALVFKAAGRNPVAGLLGSYAIGLAAFASTPFVTSTDALLSGITNAAAAPVAAHVLPVTVVSNLYINWVLAAVLTVAGGLLVDKVLEPQLNRAGVGVPGAPGMDDAEQAGQTVTAAHKSALRWAGATFLVVSAAILALALPPGAPLRNAQGGFLPKSPLMSSVMVIVFTVLLFPGLVYGIRLKLLNGTASVVALMVESVKEAAPFIVISFMLAQFLALFTWSGLASWVAVNGAEALQGAHFTGFPAVLAFVAVASVLMMFITSGSSLWTLIGSVFVPMFALLGYEPGFIQAAFRLGDSAMNVLTPLNPFLVVMLGYLRRYEPRAGIGSVMARMLPFTVVFWVLWAGVLALFFFTGTGTGPGMEILTAGR